MYLFNKLLVEENYKPLSLIRNRKPNLRFHEDSDDGDVDMDILKSIRSQKTNHPIIMNDDYNSTLSAKKTVCNI